MIHRRDRILPGQRLFRNQRPEITHNRAHVAVGQLVPRPRECIRELIRMLVEAPRNLFVCRIEAQREVRGQHGWRVLLRRIMRIRHRAVAGAILRRPLIRTRRTLGQLPVVFEKIFEEVVAPLCRRRGPRNFKTTADGVSTKTFTKFILPPEALVLDVGAFRFIAHVVSRNGSAMGLPEGYARRQSVRLFLRRSWPCA